MARLLDTDIISADSRQIYSGIPIVTAVPTEPKVYYGARDAAMGACGGVLNLFMEDFPNTPALVGGILEVECREVLADFFRGLRK